jgi:hypothetical protein
VVTLHNLNHTLRVPAGYGLEISQSLTTATEPGRTLMKLINNNEKEPTVTELIDHLDELIDQIDRYHEALTQILRELDPDSER